MQNKNKQELFPHLLVTLVVAMDLLSGAGAVVSSVPAEGGKKRGISLQGAASGSGANSQMQELSAKLLLNLAQRSRMTQAVLFRVARVTTDSEYTKAGKAGLAEFIAVSKKFRDQGMEAEDIADKLGTPDTHVFNAVVKCYLSKLQASELKTALETAVSKWDSWRVIEVGVKVFKFEKAWDSKFKKLTFHIGALHDGAGSTVPNEDLKPGEMFMKHVLPTILAEHAKHKMMVGQPPAGDLERRIQRMIDTEE